MCTKPTNTKEFCTLCGFDGELRLASWVGISRQALRDAFWKMFFGLDGEFFVCSVCLLALFFIYSFVFVFVVVEKPALLLLSAYIRI